MVTERARGRHPKRRTLHNLRGRSSRHTARLVRIDRGFETTGIEPWTYLLSPGQAMHLWVRVLHLQVASLNPTLTLEGLMLDAPALQSQKVILACEVQVSCWLDATRT
eukprot:scaffold62895_cov78-Phaeocystis_antarctica.AAC.1